MADDVYIHGADPDEQARLELMNGLLNEACLEELELEGHERVLDGSRDDACEHGLDAGALRRRSRRLRSLEPPPRRGDLVRPALRRRSPALGAR